MKPYLLMLIAILFCMAAPASAVIYQWVDETGQTQFTDDYKKIPEKYRAKAMDFDKVEHKGSATHDPALDRSETQAPKDEPFWKRFLRAEEEREQEKRAKADTGDKVILYMANW